MVLELNPNYSNNQYWLGWRHTAEKLDFRAFNSDAIFELADREKLDQKTEVIMNAVLAEINELKNKLQQQ